MDMKSRAVLMCLLPLAVGVATVARAASEPSYPITAEVHTTLDRTVVPNPLPGGTPALLPCQVSEYAYYHYGDWDWDLTGFPFLTPDMETGAAVPSSPDPAAATLLSFFTMSDVHLTDKESPAQVLFYAYEGGPLANSSAYSAIILSTTHVLDAAVQTINALHQEAPFDFGIALGDAVNNNQYNELRWYIDVLDGKKIKPSSGAHKGAKTIGYQKPYQAAGLDKSIPWYQAIGNHDQFWSGVTLPDDYIQETLVGSRMLNLGIIPPNQAGALNGRGFYMGVVDGETEFGDIINVGSVSYFLKPPKIRADSKRRSLTARSWMREFRKTTSLPVGHGFTKEMVDGGFACYHVHPKADIPIKVIVLDDTDKAGSAGASLDYRRYDWLVKELDDGESANELMIICAHIPVSPYEAPTDPPTDPPLREAMFASYSMISEATLLAKLHTYKNLILWISGHMHRNTISPQPASDGDPEYSFWEVETPSLRDFPQQFRRFEIVRNSDNTISIFAIDVDPAVNPALQEGASSPAYTSRSYAIATQEIFGNPVYQGLNVDPSSGVYNAELVKQLSPEMQAVVAQISPVVSSFSINDNAASTRSAIVTLSNTIAGSTPVQYMASQRADFGDVVWLPYSKALSFPLTGDKYNTVYFKVRDGSGTESAVVFDSIVLR